MEYKDLVKHHTQLIKDKNDNKWEVVETSDLEEICEAYHQHKLKLLGITNVVGQSEQLKCSGCNKPLRNGLCGECCSDLASGMY